MKRKELELVEAVPERFRDGAWHERS